MNTNPDDTRLALWLEDELEGEELATFEKWVADNPELLAAREEARRWRTMMAENIPAEVEPPYADFFNSRVQKAIHDLQPAAPAAAPSRFSLRSWLMPVAACAGMVIAFQIGMKKAGPPEIDVTGAPRAIPVEPVLYTPENGVAARWFDSEGALATVIVLDGVQAIPDEIDFSHTVYLNREREIDSTAAIESETPAVE
jgi:hypothetical protein